MERRKNIIIAALIITLVFMSVGYSALSQVLEINGTANIDASWDVEITDIKAGTLVGATVSTENPVTYTATSANFDVSLAYPGANASFTVTVENKGTIEAKLESITGIDTANAAAPEDIQYTITGIDVEDTLAPNQTAKAVVTVTWVSKDGQAIPTTKSKTATINLNYVQNA